ncbi:MAG: acetyl esterase [Colwellia sp.]
MKTVKQIANFSLFLLLFSSTVFADVSLPRLISDGVILQRDNENLIWGGAENGENISVKLDGKLVASLVVDKKNQTKLWSFKLAEQPVGGPHKIEIEANNNVVINDIYFGDVWLASGQSNMQLPMARVKVKYPQEVAQANFPQLRHFVIPRKYNFEKPNMDVENGQWQSVNSKTIEEFSAVGYFFAKEIHQKHQVPIGIINSSYGGSPAEAWMSESALKQFPKYLEKIAKYRQKDYLKNLIASDKKHSDGWYENLNVTDLGLTKSGKQEKFWYQFDYNSSHWQTTELPSFWQDTGVEFKNGAIWFRKEFQLTKAEASLSALLSLGRIVDADTTYVNGVEVGNTTYQYPPRRYSVEKNILKAGKNTITVRVISNSGKGGFVKEKPYFIKIGERKINLEGIWQYRVGSQVSALAGPEFQSYGQPLGFYNAMLAPLLKTTIKGVIWYQGESNTGRAQEYSHLFPAMIRDWRKQFAQGDFPFIYVQLANFLEDKEQPSESNWAETREAQRKALSEPNTAMAVAIDIGEWNDIHPLNKKMVGERLALAAQKLAYGDLHVVYSGPQIKAMTVNGKKALLSFNLFGSDLALRINTEGNSKLRGFAIAASDGKYVWANAKIVNNKIHVWNDKILNPTQVRYAWADNPSEANLVNKAGLPASSFHITK